MSAAEVPFESSPFACRTGAADVREPRQLLQVERRGDAVVGSAQRLGRVLLLPGRLVPDGGLGTDRCQVYGTAVPAPG
jgi:hypothetical protein